MRKRPVLIDTQLLVLLVVGATSGSLISRHKRTSERYNQTDFKLLLDLLGYAPKFVFCPQVAAETSNLAAQHSDPERAAIMATLKALLDNAEELAISCSAAMTHPDFIALGLADAAQLALCTADTVLLTDDGPLYRAAAARGVTALHFKDEKFRRNRSLA